MGLRKFHDIYVNARVECNARFPDNPVPDTVPIARAKEWQSKDGHRDAFRHTYWNARLAQEFGRDWAHAFTTAHEGLPNNPAHREAMDLYNNALGIGIGAANPKATPEELSRLVLEAVAQGKTVVIDSGGQLQWSDRVPVGRHGLTPPDVIAPHMARPQVVPTHSAALSPQARTLLQDSEQQVRRLAQRHGIPWDQGLDMWPPTPPKPCRTQRCAGPMPP